MKTVMIAITALALLAMPAMALPAPQGCTVNWLNGDCGPRAANAGHQEPKAPVEVVKPEKPCREEENETKAKSI